MTFNRPEPSITLRRSTVEYMDKKLPKDEAASAEAFWTDEDAMIITNKRVVNLYEDAASVLQVKERFFDSSSTWEYVD